MVHYREIEQWSSALQGELVDVLGKICVHCTENMIRQASLSKTFNRRIDTECPRSLVHFIYRESIYRWTRLLARTAPFAYS